VGVLFFRSGCGDGESPTAPDNSINPPGTPSYLSVTSLSENSLRLEWLTIGNITQYEIERADSTISFVRIGITNASTPSFTDYGLDKSKYYFYRVRAKRDSVYGNYSDIIKAGYNLSIQLLRVINDDITSQLAISSDGKYLIGYGKSSSFNIWNTQNWYVLRPSNANGGTINDALVLNNSHDVVTSEYSYQPWFSKIKVWQSSDGALKRTIYETTSSARITSMAVTPDGSTLAGVDSRNYLRLWKIADGSLLQILDTLSYDVAISPNSNILVDLTPGVMKVWNLDTKQITSTLTGTFYHPVYSQTGSLLMMDSPGIFTIYRTSDWTSFYSSGFYQYSVAFSPNDSVLIYADQNRVKLVRTKDGSLIQSLIAHSDAVNSLVFFPNGQQFATCGLDNTIKVWSTSLIQQWSITQ
jgi:WD40 repeat protein